MPFPLRGFWEGGVKSGNIVIGVRHKPQHENLSSVEVDRADHSVGVPYKVKCFPLARPCPSAAEQAREASPAGCHRRGLGQRCLFLGNEPEAGPRETIPGGRDHRRVGECCSRSSL